MPNDAIAILTPRHALHRTLPDCMQWRGVKNSDARMSNSVMRGAF